MFNPATLRILSELLEQRTGQLLADNRLWRIDTTLGPLMREKGVSSVNDLAMQIADGREPALAERMAEALLNNETFFFRDPPAFNQLLALIDDRMRNQRSAQRRMRIWSAGCSTGQEAYSLAIHFAENAERWAGWMIDIVATDVSRSAIQTGRSGIFSQFEIQRGLSVHHMLRWFEAEGDQWRAAPELRRAIKFHSQSLLDPVPPGDKFDVILCRNVLLYFTKKVRGDVFDRLRSGIAADGILMMGAGETVLGQTNVFESDPEARGFYRASAAMKLAANG